MTDEEKELWLFVYKSAIGGFYMHDKYNGIEHELAKEAADESVRKYREAITSKLEDSND